MKKRTKGSDSARHFPVRLLAGIFLIAVVVFVGVLAYRQTVTFFTTADFFAIRSIEMDASLEALRPRLAKLKGKNLFAVDLPRIQRQLQLQYPDVAQLKLSRQFPDQIRATAQKRVPVARVVIKGKTWGVDKDGVILFAPTAEAPALPLINFNVTKSVNPVPGFQLKNTELSTALQIVKAFQSQPALSTYQMEKLDVANLSQIYFFINGPIRVIMDRENIPDRMSKLGLLLTQAKPELAEVKYIDMRFNDPILGKK